MATPLSPASLGEINTSEGLETSLSPWLFISKMPSSGVDPKRFFIVRSIL